MASLRRTTSYRGLVAALLVMPLLGAGGTARAADNAPTVARARFQLRADCTCASCGFALESQLRKLPGVARVSLSQRDRVITISFDENRITLSKVRESLVRCELGKRSLLVLDLPEPRPIPDPATLQHLPGVRSASVDRKHRRLLLELSENATLSTGDLTAALAKAGVEARIEGP